MDILCYFLFLLPKNLVSFCIGKILHAPLPAAFRGPAIRAFARWYGVNTEESAKPCDSYASIGAFFTRELREGCRPVGALFVSPVDGFLRNAGRVHEGRLPQVKGEGYTVASLLKDSGGAERFSEGSFFNLYLSPRDYHHVHSPIDGEVAAARVIPGHLWPVNEWSLRRIDGVFAQNERVVVYMDTTVGRVAVVMVGAFNVGRISVTFDTFETNTALRGKAPGGFSVEYHPAKSVRAGDRLGTFHLGSSVIVLVEAGSPLSSAGRSFREPGPVRFGEALVLPPVPGSS